MMPTLASERTASIDSAALPGSAVPVVKPQHKTFVKRVLHWVRRGHLYFGLFLFPWAVLYGITAFLFNHPGAFAETATYTFGHREVAGTSLESLPTPGEQASAVTARLNEKQTPNPPYETKPSEGKYGARETISGSIRSGTRTFTIFYNVVDGHGGVRETTPPQPPGEKAPFATGTANPGKGGGKAPGSKTPRASGGGEGIRIDEGIVDRFKAAVPTILERLELPPGDLTVTAAPDVKFPIVADGKTWVATYSTLAHSVSGTSPDLDRGELPFRRFLLRMHLMHGYPGEVNARWIWAVIVDGMAATMCFWALSGLVMWWQIKSTRRWGLATLLASVVCASIMAFAMHAFLST
ncbi:MAG: hypothetical protein K2X38_19845 [Gemmataceae bacterium]|nr:hypothetical protein [Gemmataceae bacterium]